MKITFLLSNIPNPRNNKRITAFSKIADVDVICSHRVNMDVFPLDNISGVNYHVVDLEVPTVRHIFKRGLSFLKYYSYCKKQLRRINPDVVYLCGLDNLMIAATSTIKRTKICYEVADLRESYTNEHTHTFSREAIFDFFVNKLEKWYSRRVSLLVVTSIKFYDVHYCKLFSRNKVLEVPNMPNLQAFDKYTPKQGGDFTIGFVGGIRYLGQMKMLVDGAGEAGVKVVFSGASFDRNNVMVEYCKDKPWVSFTGRFDFMKDIAGIYHNLDCVYSVYDASNFNVRIALPNKLYEAVVAEIPIIVANNTYLGELVTDWGTGVAIDYDNKTQLISELLRLKNKEDYYNGFVEACRAKKKDINVTKYITELCARVQSIVKDKNSER